MSRKRLTRLLTHFGVIAVIVGLAVSMVLIPRWRASERARAGGAALVETIPGYADSARVYDRLLNDAHPTAYRANLSRRGGDYVFDRGAYLGDLLEEMTRLAREGGRDAIAESLRSFRDGRARERFEELVPGPPVPGGD